MIEINNTTKYQVDALQIKALGTAFLKAFKQPAADISVAIVGPARMRRLNRDYRGLDKPTDVLSFPASTRSSGQAGLAYLGEVIINWQEVEKVNRYRAMLAELALPPFRSPGALKKYLFNFLLVHGLLHLVGYDDSQPDKRREMLILGRDFLRKML